MNYHKLSIPFAFVAVLIIWSTTPLAIKWSAVDAPMTSALVRMIIGVLFCLVVLGLSTTKLPLSPEAIRIYVFSGLSIFIGMSLFYLAAQKIPSGWIAVLFGLSPLTTGLFSAVIEPETRLTLPRLCGIILGFSGLYLVFSAGLNVAEASVLGVTYTLLATIISSATSVITRQLVKSINLTGMQITTGSLIVAIPFFALSAWLFQPAMHTPLTDKALVSTLYLGLIGTGIGFTLYYFLLKHITANKVALITLITPIAALSIGSLVNNEPLIADVWIGAGLVCTGLLIYEFKPRLGLRKL